MKFLAVSALVASASAHATFQQLWVAGKDQGTSCVRPPANNSPMTNVNSPDMSCNVGGSKGVAGLCKVNAGDKVDVEIHQHNTRACTEEAIGGKHYGPVMVYMCSVPDAKSATGDCSWTKVAEDTYAGTDASWGTEKLNKNCGKFQFTVPSSLKAGQYLIRAEALALHSAGGANGAQFYMSCYQIDLGGSGTASLSGGVRFPGAYKASDPGILINIYSGVKTYKAPGPAVWRA